MRDEELDGIISRWMEEPCQDYGHTNKRATAMWGFRCGYRAAQNHTKQSLLKVLIENAKPIEGESLGIPEEKFSDVVDAFMESLK